jgi:hypothetical protein
VSAGSGGVAAAAARETRMVSPGTGNTDDRCRSERCHRACARPGELPLPLGSRERGDLGALQAAPGCRARTRRGSAGAAAAASRAGARSARGCGACTPSPATSAAGRSGQAASCRPVRLLAQRYGMTADAVMRAQDELLSAGVLSRGHVYGTLHVSPARDRRVPSACRRTRI